MSLSSPSVHRSAFKLPQDEFQQLFLKRIGGAAEIRQLFEHIDGVCFFMKDREGRFIAIGEGPRQDINHDEQSLIGLTDYDLYPRHIADRTHEDDRHVMDTDRPLLNIIEILVNPKFKTIGWYVSNKFPVHDSAGRVIGVMGTVQPFVGYRKRLFSGTRLDDTLDYIEKHCSEPLSVETLACGAAMSPRQFRRKFHDVFGLSPQDFILRTRLMKACTALVHTQQNVADIAFEYGFYDQSAMTLQFRNIIGMTPLEYRQRYTSLLVSRHQP